MKKNKIFYLLIFLFLVDLGLSFYNFISFISPEFNGLFLGTPIFIINFIIFIFILNKKYRKLSSYFFICLLITQFIIVMYAQKLQHQGNQFGSIDLSYEHYIS